jgi:hypothetical protein
MCSSFVHFNVGFLILTFMNLVTEMKALTKSICWELVSISKDQVNGVGVAIYKKPLTNECYEERSKNEPPLCQDSDDPNAAWYSFLN